jgi:hypothetical protein
MTMNASRQAEPTSEPRRTFGIVTIQGRILDLSDSLTARPMSSVTWKAHPAGPLYGLTATADDHEASISRAAPPETLRETSSSNAPEELRAYARQTYLAYVDLCLRLGEFQLEATPITGPADEITGTSLRARLVERGAAWLDTLPTADRQRFAPTPRADELTMVDVPDTPSPPTVASSQPTHDESTRPRASRRNGQP